MDSEKRPQLSAAMGNIGLYSTTATYLASKEIKISEKTQNKGCYAV